MVDVDWNDHASHDETPFGPSPPPGPKATTAATASVALAKAAPQATNNAKRTSEREITGGPYAAAGYAPGGHAHYAGVAIVKGRDANGGELEAMSVSVQTGAQHEAQATILRVGFSDSHVAISGEAGTANAHVGVHNADGSTGVNTGVGAIVMSAEGTIGGAANSVTVGTGVGVGAEGSLGLRDKDGNGEPEVCFRLGVKFATVGACIELPFHGKM